jgi:Common central domain of tyrosinase/Polyphenol oxidase middle domain
MRNQENKMTKFQVRVALRVLFFAVVIGTACSAQAGQVRQLPGPIRLAKPQVRMSWQTFISGPAGAQRLASLKKAITKMKSLDNSPPTSIDFRRSWTFWANVHGYYGPQSTDGTVAQQIQYLQSIGYGQYVSYYQGISDQVPPDSVAAAVWATCQHSNGPGAGQANFFGWHRMYLYYFERVLRWAANDNTLRLPYWDYTNASEEQIPAEFRQLASVFYDDKRNPGMNQGTSKLNSNSTNINQKLTNSNYLSYEYDVETTIHGYVHCTVGPTCPVAHMGDVPVAANDPVFYTHHANIDRMWSCWQHLYTTPTTGSWLTQQFTFTDENGTSHTDPVSKFVDTAKLGYVYDNVSACSRSLRRPIVIKGLAMEQQNLSPDEKFPTIIASSKPVPITQAHTSVDIAVPSEKVPALLTAPSGAPANELVLRNITAKSPPGALLDVYIARKDQPSKKEFVGTVNWFGAFRHHGVTGPDQRTLQFDITDQLKALGITSNTTALTVTFEATDGRVPAAAPKAGALLAKTAPAVRPESGLQIGAIELRHTQ